MAIEALLNHSGGERWNEEMVKKSGERRKGEVEERLKAYLERKVSDEEEVVNSGEVVGGVEGDAEEDGVVR